MGQKNLILSMVSYGFVCLIGLALISSDYRTQFELPVLFHVRELLGQEPALSENLVVFAMDDRAREELGERDLSPEEWSRILSLVAETNPLSVIVNKNFSFPVGALEEGTGAFFALPSSVEPTGRARIHRPVLAEGHFHGVKEELRINGQVDRVRGQFELGHTQPMKPGLFMPWLRSTKSSYLSRHLGLMVGPKSDSPVQEGWSYVNSLSSGQLSSRIYSFKGLIQSVERGLSLDSILPSGRVVLMLPRFSTGDVNNVWTPFGVRSANFELVSIVSAVMEKKWLKHSQLFNILVVILAGILLFAFCQGSPKRNLVMALVAPLGVLVAACLSMAFGGFVFEWVVPSIGMGLGFAVVAASSSLQSFVKGQLLEQALLGVVSGKEISKMKHHSDLLNIEPAEQELTIVFLDIVGFSMTVENATPRRTFHETVKFMEALTEIIHRHGGIVNKNLGDGLISFFGYDPFRRTQVPGHACAAVKACLEIQTRVLELFCESGFESRFPFPLRIGVNTAEVLVGNIGGSERFELTLLGPGVNFASRLESACEPFAIVISEHTLDGIRSENPQEIERNIVHEKLIKVKHVNDLVTCYEISPESDKGYTPEQAMNHFADFNHIRRESQRLKLSIKEALIYSGDGGDFQLVDYSRGGACFLGKRYFGKGVQLRLTPSGLSPIDEKALKEAMVLPLVVEVRWGKVTSQGVLQGVRFMGLNALQTDALLQAHDRCAGPAKADSYPA